MRDIETEMAEARARWADDIGEFSAPLTSWMLERLDLRAGQSVLDIAGGVGDPALEIARGIGPSGRLTSIDISAPAVDIGRRRAREHGLDEVTFRVMDAQRMDLPSDSVDRAVCRWGFMLMPDPEAALNETRRVLRAEGRLVFAVWGPAAENPWARRMRLGLEMLGRVEPIDPSAPGGMFSLPDESSIRPLLERTGWEVLEIAPIRLTWRYPDFQAYWDYAVAMAGDLGPVLSEMSGSSDLDTLRNTVEEGSSGFAADGGYAFPALSLGVLASGRA